MKNNVKIVIISIISLIFCFSTATIVEDDKNVNEIIQWCEAQCSNQNASEINKQDNECGSYMSQYFRGCAAWTLALNSSCPEACSNFHEQNSTNQELLQPKELYCVMGCNFALHRYFEIQKEKLGTPTTPALVADSLTATSLSLDWGGELNVSREKLYYQVKWKYEDIPGSCWQYFLDKNWSTETFAQLDNLKPYTKYRFRVAAIVSRHPAASQIIIESLPSVVIETAAQGSPLSSPTNVRATAVDSTRISVSWEPALFPSGPVLVYELHLVELDGGTYSATKEVPASTSTLSYMFQNVPSEKNFKFTVTTRNWQGAGPLATVTVSTPRKRREQDRVMEAQLLLATQFSVIKQSSSIMGDPEYVYNSTREILGFAIHSRYNVMFISDKSGNVIRQSLHSISNIPEIILTEQSLGFSPRELSIDWLNDLLYVVGESSNNKWRIIRCKLDGQGITVAVAGFYTKPLHIQIDPYNGYMFWVMEGGRKKGGLYRLDLAEVSNGVRHETRPELMFEHSALGAFTIDHANFRLLVADQANNTILGISLDGKETNDLRKNTQTALFKKVTSLATANGIFFWTNKAELYGEDYNADKDSYFHFSYPLIDTRNDYLLSVTALSPASQPTPIPVNPPTALQAVLGHNNGKLAWQPPHLLGGQGKGAWQNWTYEVELRSENNESIIKRDIISTSLSLTMLEPDTLYSIKACAYTSAGKGPWSTEFKGRSFRAPSTYYREPTLVWAAREGLMQSDITGDNINTLINSDSLQDYRGPVQITWVSWYEDKLYLATNTSQTLWFNITDRTKGYLDGVDSAGSIAVDWLGRRLYWSNPKQPLITRATFDGKEQEHLPILDLVKELHVDSINAFLYWSTGHAVKCARLNGQHQQTYFSAEYFSGKVMGLTLEPESNQIYWIVRSYEGSYLYRAPMASDSSKIISPEKISTLAHPVVQGPLCYYSDHLLWLQDSKTALMSDITGHSTAVILGEGAGISGLNFIGVIDPERQSIPSVKLSVIPTAVRRDTIKLIGNWDSFNITWSTVTNVNYGEVFYHVTVKELLSQKEFTNETLESSIEYPHVLAPYSQLEVSVRAFTYWGSSHGARSQPVRLRTPSATPSAPESPRAYVINSRKSPLSENDIRIQFRWNPPLAPNGVVEKYRVKICLEEKENECHMYNLDSSKLEFTATELLPYSEYNFQVWATTSAGEGPASEIIIADTTFEYPVPRLIIGTREALSITDLDRLSGPTDYITTTVLRSEPQTSVTYLAIENRFYWFSQDRTSIYTNLFEGSSIPHKVVSLRGLGNSLSIDWISRTLYWAETNLDIGSTIWKLDLETNRQTIVAIRNTIISVIQVSPLTSSLYWVENDENIFASRLDGSRVKLFFDLNPRCTCKAREIMSKSLTLDSSKEKIELFWSDAETGNIIASTLDGCDCRIVVNASTITGYSANVLTIDRNVVFWSGGRDGKLYSAPIITNTDHDYYTTSSGSNILSKAETTILPLYDIKLLTAIGTHLQPFPANEKCLLPIGGRPILVSRGPRSLKLKIPNKISSDDPECKDISMPSPRYNVYFSAVPCDVKKVNYNPCTPEELDNCSHLETFESEVEISDLNPFTCYTIMAAIGNYYADAAGIDISPFVGKPIIFQTQPGAPTKPRHLIVKPLSPWSLKITWLPPEDLHGSIVKYMVMWSTEVVEEHTVERQKGELPISPDTNVSSGREVAMLEKLLPNQTYSIWVRSYSEENPEEYSETDVQEVLTYPEPNYIFLMQATPYSLNLTWKHNAEDGNNDENVESSIQMTKVSKRGKGLPHWQDIKETYEGSNYYLATDLRPKTLYEFRISLRYPGALNTFTWPPDNRFTFETKGDIPSAPGTPYIKLMKNNIYEVSWDPSEEHGAHIDMYYLEAKIAIPETTKSPRTAREAPGFSTTENPNKVTNEDWQLFYNGTDNHWIISSKLSNDITYTFRVRAHNLYGYSDWSPASKVFDWSGSALLGTTPNSTIVVTTIVPILCVLLFLAFVLLFLIHRNRRRAAEKQKQSLQIPLNRSDVELANLREVPRSRRGLPMLQHSNILYTAASELNLNAINASEITALPQIQIEQITFRNFLGCGEFGEVFEGIATGLNDNDLKVAVKTLRKGSTEHEKNEFLKEAILMSNFNHKNILQLLGVCLSNGKNFIIMELMEGGDLLSYLRRSRPLATTGELTLIDLISIAVDVARGCRYLEEMHYVHRDLACRNCLVSFENNSQRVIKIGDFGLARDIYKNDYYRKEGSEPLPVRWMAPESLLDGVFTSQSDAWAFGVLIWEVLTMGQQPYPARTITEVYNYVREGGHPSRPTNCPDVIFNLLRKCWHHSPESRPTFKYSLEVLEKLKLEMEQNPIPIPIITRFAKTGLDNAGFCPDEYYIQPEENKSNDMRLFNGSGSSLFQPATVSLPPESTSSSNIPKYLVMMDNDSEEYDCESGYEKPRKFPPVVVPPPPPTITTTTATTNDSTNDIVWFNDLNTSPRPRAYSVGCDDLPSLRLINNQRSSSAERLLTTVVPYSNIITTCSQPLLNKRDTTNSDSSGFSSQESATCDDPVTISTN